MKLLKLALNNFRAFYGEQVLDLSVTEGKPAVLIFGNNGAGKTTLLNAFGWSLYGTFSDDTEQNHRVIHDRKWAETAFGESVAASVRLDFEHEGVCFAVTRDVTVTKRSEEQQKTEPNLTMLEIGPDGEAKSVPNGQDRIEKILPEGLRRFFFFNGERMEKMFSGDGKDEEVKRAIKTLLNLEAIERALGHLPKARQKLARAIDTKGDTRLKELTDSMEELDVRIKRTEEEKEHKRDDVRKFQEEIDSIGDALRQHDRAKPLQQERDKLTRHINDERNRHSDLRDRKRGLISSSGHLAFTSGIDTKVLNLADQMRERRQLPAGIQRSFIEDLLNDELCMCGRPVIKGTSEYEELDKRRYNAGLEDVQARWLHLSGQMRNMRDSRQRFLDQLSEITADIKKADEAISQLEAERSEVDRQLEGVNIQDVQRLLDRRRDYVEKQQEARFAYRQAEEQITRMSAELDKEQKKYRSTKAENEASRRIQDQVNLVDSVNSALAEILAIKTEEVRDQLDMKVKEVFSRIFIKSSIPELNDSFELELRSESGVAIRSTGENQILGLSFVGAVSEVAKSINDRKKQADGIVLNGSGSGVYPVVMDAPFGSLDLTYQEEISKALPALTSQIVTLLSQSQARGKVKENLQSAASQMYVLRTFTPNLSAGQESIEINNRAVPYVSHGEFEHTVLEKVAV
ncbi:AAA family ATPase [Streptomyces griseus]|uniref:AAA family ATPase n=1 Tax=Streptomyces griseus TaxID=1911 RepID=UPI003674CB23